MTTKNTPARVTLKTAEQARTFLAEFDERALERFADADSYKVTVQCKRCGGAGYYPTPQHGACYECGGNPAAVRYTRTVTVVDVAKRVRREQLARAKRQRIADKAQADAAEFLSTRPDLARALELDHSILADLRAKLNQYGDLSEKQVELALKIEQQLAEREQEREQLVAAPIADKRQTVEGEVVSVKWMDSDYGGSFKVTVKVTEGEGHWLAWGTLPREVEDVAQAEIDALPTWEESTSTPIKKPSMGAHLRGRSIKFDARLKAGREAHFALFSRPTKAALI